MDARPNLHENLFSRNSTPPANPTAAPSLIDSRFQNIPPPDPQPEQHPLDLYDQNPLPDEQTSRSSPTASVAERQNALLSLIGGPPPSSANRPPQLPQQQPPVQSQPQPQQIPTPPGSSQRSNASPPQTDTQKMLEQIISG